MYSNHILCIKLSCTIKLFTDIASEETPVSQNRTTQMCHPPLFGRLLNSTSNNYSNSNNAFWDYA